MSLTLLETIGGPNGEAEIYEYEPSCWVPCDHVPVRSWPLFRARQLMRDVIESFKREQES